MFVAFGLTDPMEGYQGSPYPEIDNFVRSLVNKDGLQGGKETMLLCTNESSAALFLKNLKFLVFFLRDKTMELLLSQRTTYL